MARARTRPTAVSEPGFTELTSLMNDINKQFGNGVMQRAGALQGMKHVPTNVFMLDYALLGGLAEGFATMLYGYESSGKTTLAMRISAAMQEKFPDRAVVYLDAEGTYDNTWASYHGVDRDRLFYAQPTSGEEAVDIAHGVLSTDETSLLIVDSLPALIPQKEGDASAEDDFMALRARLVAKLCSKVLYTWHANSAASKRRVSVIFINQFRSKVGVVMGDPRHLPAGNQPRYLSSTMIEIKNKEVTGKNSSGIDIVTHNDHSFTVKKSKAGNSIRTGSFKMIRDPEHHVGMGGIDDAAQVVAYAKKMGYLSGGGTAQYLASLGDQKFGNMLRIQEHLEDNPHELLRAKQMLIGRQRAAMGLPVLPPDGYLMGSVDNDILALAQAT